MKQLIKFILFFSLTAIGAKELKLGSPIPMADVRMPDITGQEIALNDVKGENGLLVIFSCNTCPWVLAWEDRYVDLADSYQSKGVGIIAINSNEKQFNSVESIDEMQKHAKEKGYNFYYTMDDGSTLAREFGASRTPHIFLFNKEDKLVYRGAIDDNARKPEKVKYPYLADAIDNMLAGKQIEPAATKALGCSIKFIN